MSEKPLSKVTLNEIINNCGVNRKTFYYHFEDIYALLKWMLEQEAIEVLKNFNLLVNPEKAIAFVIDYLLLVLQYPIPNVLLHAGGKQGSLDLSLS